MLAVAALKACWQPHKANKKVSGDFTSSHAAFFLFLLLLPSFVVFQHSSKDEINHLGSSSGIPAVSVPGLTCLAAWRQRSHRFLQFLHAIYTFTFHLLFKAACASLQEYVCPCKTAS